MTRLARARRGLAKLAVVGAVAVVATAGGGTAWALTHPSGDGAIRYGSASAMAAQAGCTSSYRPMTTYAGVVSAGRCQVHGAWVELRVLPSLAAAYAWLDGAHGPSAKPTGFGVVGDGWVAHSFDRTAMVRVTRALTTT